MKKSGIRKALNAVTTVLVVMVVLLAVALVGVRIVGIRTTKITLSLSAMLRSI